VLLFGHIEFHAQIDADSARMINRGASRKAVELIW
jgi:hypothetical protein